MGKARKIVIEGETFYYTPQASETDTTGVLFLVQADKKPQHRLSIFFPHVGDKYTGNPLPQGLLLSPEHPERSRVNLHTPSLAAQLILYGLQAGWQPEKRRMDIEDGLGVLRELGYAISR